MAKIVEEVLVVKFSKIVKDTGSDDTSLLNSDIQSAVEQLAQEIVGDSIVVEVVKA
jgi:hypothetical protein